MDSINLSDTQNTPLNSKSTASNTNPAPCGCCALKDYAQILPQAQYFRVLNPGLPNCKHSQDNGEGKFGLQQPFFPSLPLFQPFFHNSVFPSNSCCFHKPLNDSFSSEQQTQTTNEQDKIPQPANFICQKEKSCIRVESKQSEENAQKTCGLGSEMQYFSNPLNFLNTPDTQMNYFHRCGYNDAFPWTCNPFVVPIISYCVLWNSQKSNMSICGNYSCASTETLSQKKNGNLEDRKYSSSSPTEEISSTNYDEKKKDQCIENFYENVSFEKTKEGEKMPSFMIHSSLSYNEENSFENNEQTDENIKNLTSGLENVTMEGEDSEGDAEQTKSVNLVESEEFSKLDEKEASNLSTISTFSNDPYETYLKDDSQLTSGSQSFSNFKKLENESANVSGVLSASNVNPLNTSAKGGNHFHDERMTINHFQENNSSDESKNKKDVTVATSVKKSKKFIKNFTVTDQINGAFYEDARMSVEAAGDLGGDSCVGYKVNIQEIEGSRPDKIPREIQENFQSKELFLEASGEVKKNTPESQKTGRTFKSGIAKLSHHSNLKESKQDPTKNNKKEPNQRDCTQMKRKHTCFPVDNTMGPYDSSSKIQKTRNLRVVQQHVQGPEKQQKITQNKKESLKKEEKSTKLKITPVWTSQKLLKCTAKK